MCWRVLGPEEQRETLCRAGCSVWGWSLIIIIRLTDGLRVQMCVLKTRSDYACDHAH